MKAAKIRDTLLLGAAVMLCAALAPSRPRNGRRAMSRWWCRFRAGVASDIVARVVFEQVGKQVGQTFVIENRLGAGGTIGANMVAKAAPDGHTILVYGSIAAANALYTKLPYDTVERFHAGRCCSARPRWSSSRRRAVQDARRARRRSEGQAWRIELLDRRASDRPRTSAPRGLR